VFRAIPARYPRFQEALVLEEVQRCLYRLALVSCVGQNVPALQAAKAIASLKIQLQQQTVWFAFKSTLRYLPSRFELQGRGKQ